MQGCRGTSLFVQSQSLLCTGIEAREQGMPCAGLVHHKQYFMVPPELQNPKEETVIQGRKEQMCKQSTELFCNEIHCFVQ